MMMRSAPGERRSACGAPWPGWLVESPKERRAPGARLSVTAGPRSAGRSRR